MKPVHRIGFCIGFWFAWLPAVMAQPGWAYPGDFSSEAIHIDFDELNDGQAVMNQYRLQGVVVTTPALQALDLQQHFAAAAPSEPNVLGSENEQRIGLRFQQPVQRLGMKVVGSFGPNDVLYLRTYDRHGNTVYDAVYIPPASDTVTLPSSALPYPNQAPAVFIGVQADKPVIWRAELEIPAGKPTLMDDLVFEPGPDNNSATVLDNALDNTPDDAEALLAALDEVLEQPSPAAAESLRRLVGNETIDTYVRERAALALASLGDAQAIATLSKLALDSRDANLRMAAHQAVWSLRQIFPLAGPPQVEIVPPSAPITDTNPFDVTVKLTWPLARKQVKLWLTGGKGLALLQNADSSYPARYSGPVEAGETVVLQGRYQARKVWTASPDGKEKFLPQPRTRFQIIVRIDEGPVDTSTLRFPVYVDFEQGSVSDVPPNTGQTAGESLLPTQGGQAQ